MYHDQGISVQQPLQSGCQQTGHISSGGQDRACAWFITLILSIRSCEGFSHPWIPHKIWYSKWVVSIIRTIIVLQHIVTLEFYWKWWQFCLLYSIITTTCERSLQSFTILLIGIRSMLCQIFHAAVAKRLMPHCTYVLKWNVCCVFSDSFDLLHHDTWDKSAASLVDSISSVSLHCNSVQFSCKTIVV